MFRLALLLPLLTLFAPPVPAAPPDDTFNGVARGHYGNSLRRFEQDKVGHVAFLGGSITEMNGYRPMLETWLTERFPETKLTFTNAGISSTCSTTGAFRLRRDVLAPREGVPDGGVDLLFVEFAVNDDQDAGHTREKALRGMEGIVRHVRREHPRADVVITYFVNPEMLKTIGEGTMPIPMQAHEQVADHYGVSTVHLAHEVRDRIAAGELTWETYGGTHPKTPGNRLAANLCIELLERSWKRAAKEPQPHALPKPIDGHSYDRGRLLPAGRIGTAEGWSVAEPNWRQVRGSLRARFAGRELAMTEQPRQVATLRFTGRGVGAYVLAGPDAGIVEVQVDNRGWKRIDLYHRFSKGLHYPRTVMFDEHLALGEHVLRIRSATDKNAASTGHAIRVVGWTVNGDE